MFFSLAIECDRTTKYHFRKISLKLHETNLVKVFKSVQLKILPHVGKRVENKSNIQKKVSSTSFGGLSVTLQSPILPLNILLKTLDFQLCNDSQENIYWLRVMTTSYRKQDNTHSLAMEALVFYDILEIKDSQTNLSIVSNKPTKSVISVIYSKLHLILSSSLTNFIISINTIIKKFIPLIDEFKTQLQSKDNSNSEKLVSPLSKASSSSQNNNFATSATSSISPTFPVYLFEDRTAFQHFSPTSPSPSSETPSATPSFFFLFQKPIFSSKFKIQLNQTPFLLKNSSNKEVTDLSFDIGFNIDRNDLSIYPSKLNFPENIKEQVILSDTMFDIKYKRNLNILTIVGSLPADNSVTSPGFYGNISYVMYNSMNNFGQHSEKLPFHILLEWNLIKLVDHQGLTMPRLLTQTTLTRILRT